MDLQLFVYYSHRNINLIIYSLIYTYTHILGVVKRNPLFFHFQFHAKIMDFFLLHLIYIRII